MKLDANHVMQLAHAELAEERLRAAVEARKAELRQADLRKAEHRPSRWRRLFPYSISITIKRRT